MIYGMPSALTDGWTRQVSVVSLGRRAAGGSEAYGGGVDG